MERLIREKADLLIEKNELMKLLAKYGKVHLVGSYRMQTMAWNDLDFYIETSDFDSELYCAAAAELITRLAPVRFDGINHAEKKQLFLGLEVMEVGQRWNIDIWWKEKAEIDAVIAYEDELIERMQEHPELKNAVVSIKKELIVRRLYGMDKGKKHFHSNDIYDAVLEKGILTLEQFLKCNI